MSGVWFDIVTGVVAPFDTDTRYELCVSPPASGEDVWLGWCCRSASRTAARHAQLGIAVFSVSPGPIDPAEWALRVRSDYERAASDRRFPKATVRP